ncbi:MAG: hypothetical protein EA355_12830 [Rhodobacteraceae bacterium]|nr:MAG: hypothetical protein EA355_12830 [Paracoccaceae bacterium]
MRLTAIVAVALAAALVWVGWAQGWFGALGVEAVALQRAMQDRLAAAVFAIRAGEPWALASLMGAAWLYGVGHAAGPGHGKALLAAAAVGSRASAGRMAGVALLAALAQGAVAVAVIYGALAALSVSAGAAMAAGERAAAPLGFAAAGGVGVWLSVRGVRGLRRGAALAHAPTCGCAHGCGPEAAVAAAADFRGWRETLALIAGVAARPCAGAMLVLAVAWGARIPVAGVLAVAAMALGVAAVTAAAAVIGVGARETALTAVGDRRVALAASGLQAGAGALLAAVGAAGLAASI